MGHDIWGEDTPEEKEFDQRRVIARDECDQLRKLKVGVFTVNELQFLFNFSSYHASHFELDRLDELYEKYKHLIGKTQLEI
jgi:hypothetical protein